MRAIIALSLLAGCDTVFPLEVPAIPAACAHDGLELCLAFEDDLLDGATDDNSPQHAAATAENVSAIDRLPGEHAIELGPTSLVFVDRADGYDFPGPMSIDLWVQYDGVAVGERIILDNDLQYTISVIDNAMALGCGAQIVLITGNTFPTAPLDNVTPGSWHHVACVYDEQLIHGYLDGATISGTERTTGGPIYTGGTSLLRLGRASGTEGLPRVFTGRVDNVRIWDRVLTDAEILKFANNVEK